MRNPYEKDKIRDRLKRTAPEHLEGYDNGWLDIEHHDWGVQIFSSTSEGRRIVDTIIKTPSLEGW